MQRTTEPPRTRRLGALWHANTTPTSVEIRPGTWPSSPLSIEDSL